MNGYELVSLVLTVSAAIAALLFVLGYLLRSPWWKNPAGINTMVFMAVVAVLVTLTVFFRVTDARAPAWLSGLLWGILNVPLWWRLILLWRAQHGAYTPLPHRCTSCGQSCLGS